MINWLLPTNYFMLSLFKRRDNIGEVGPLFNGLVETLKSPISFHWNPSTHLRICVSMAMGVQRTIRALCAFHPSGHSCHVDELLPGGMERSGRRSDQSKFQSVFRWIKGLSKKSLPCLVLTSFRIWMFGRSGSDRFSYLSPIPERC